MATGFYLSEEKMKLLNDLLDERNPRWTRKTTRHSQPKQIFTSPEVFLCQAPDIDEEDNGIDGLTPAGDDDYDHPGVANCTVCQIIPSISEDEDYDLVPIEDGVKQVFNYSETPIAKAEFFLALKDKFGNWVAVGSPTSLTPRILYDDVAPGDTDKNAWPCKDDMTADTDADKVLVQNPWIGFRGYGDSHTDYTATNAARIFTTITPDGKESIVSGKGLAKTIIVANTASGHAAVAKTTASFTAAFTRACDDGQVPTASSPATLVVDNPGFAIDDNATGIVCIMDSGGSHLYRIIDAPCPA